MEVGDLSSGRYTIAAALYALRRSTFVELQSARAIRASMTGQCFPSMQAQLPALAPLSPGFRHESGART